MPRRVRLDPKLTMRPFSTAEAQAAGVNRGRLESADLDRPFRGVRSVGVHSRLASYVPRLREYDRFSHTSAAELWGAPLPPRLSDVVHVTATHGAARPRARGMSGHVSRSGTPVFRRELPLSDAATTFIELASLLNERELVAVGDHLVLNPRILDPADWRPHATIEDLRVAVEREPARGVRNARRTLARVRSGVESPMETELRLLLEDAGLPRAECGYELRDANSNRQQETVDRVRPALRSVGWAPNGRKHS